MHADDVFAVPGESSIIDTINPTTGRSTINNETLEQVRLRYPNAERVAWEDWRKAQSARQHTPIRWQRCTARQYHDMLEVLPPIDWTGESFLVGEPTDHDYDTGQPRFQAYRQGGSEVLRGYFTSSRPLTRKELRRARLMPITAVLTVCANCQQWEENGPCLNECRSRGVIA